MRIKLKLHKSDYLLLMTMILSMAFRDIPVISVYVKLIFPLLILLQVGKKRIPKYKSIFIAVYFMFFLFGLLSSAWAERSDYVASQSFVLFRLYFSLFSVALLINSIEDVEKGLYMLNITGIILVIRLLIQTPLSIWRDAVFGSYDASSAQGRIGTTIGYQPNELGALCFLLLLIAIYYYFRKKTIPRALWIGILAVLLLFTKSRLSLALTIVGISVFYIVSQQRKSKQIGIAVVVSIGAIALIWASFNVPVLYNFIGFRLAGIFGTKVEQDASTLTRLNFLNYAMSLFRLNPIAGVGLDNFKYYAYNYAHAWRETYAHSNWGELLADLGLIGTMLYYVLPIGAIIRLGRNLRSQTGELRKLVAIFFSFMIVTLIGDIQKISYDRFDVMFPMMLAIFTSFYISEKQEHLP